MFNSVTSMLCSFADSVVVDGASIFIWGEKEIPENLRKKYESMQEDKDDEEV